MKRIHSTHFLPRRMCACLLSTAALIILLAAGASAAQTTAAAVTADAAQSAALTHAGIAAEQVISSRQKLERDDGLQIYDVKFTTSDSVEYEYEIDAATGEIVSYGFEVKQRSASADSGAYIGEEAATNAALALAPEAEADDVLKLKLERDDGQWIYDGKIVCGGMEYEFEIDAFTGAVLSWEAEPARR